MIHIAETVFKGRRQIFTDVDAITPENVLRVLKASVETHLMNVTELNYLYNYYKGEQPVLKRTKERNDFIVNRIVENRANEIVSFKTGYLVGEPIQYVSRSSADDITEDISTLNDYMLTINKPTKDEEVADWQHIGGVAYRFVSPRNEDDKDIPFNIFTLDPRQAFVIRSNRIGSKVLAGVHTVQKEYYTNDATPTYSETIYTVYTPVYVIECTLDRVIHVTFNGIGRVPIIEYPANNGRLGAFETVLGLLDAINELDSDRVDGVDQFIQSLLVLYNCDLPEDENASTVKEKGMLLLKSVGDAKADVKLLAEELNQAQTQTLKEDLHSAVLTIVGMPSQGNGSTGDSSNNGAVILKNGWQNAEARAKRSETIWKQSESEMLKVVLDILDVASDVHLSVRDLSIKFTRRNYEAIGEKASVFAMLMGTQYVDIRDAYTISGIVYDPEDASKRGIAWNERTKVTTDENPIDDTNLSEKAE